MFAIVTDECCMWAGSVCIHRQCNVCIIWTFSTFHMRWIFTIYLQFIYSFSTSFFLLFPFLILLLLRLRLLCGTFAFDFDTNHCRFVTIYHGNQLWNVYFPLASVSQTSSDGTADFAVRLLIAASFIDIDNDAHDEITKNEKKKEKMTTLMWLSRCNTRVCVAFGNSLLVNLCYDVQHTMKYMQHTAYYTHSADEFTYETYV